MVIYRVFGLLQNVPQDMMTLSAVATKNVTVLGVNATELFEILADVERGLVDQSLAQQQNLKLTEALMKSNTTKTEFEEDYAK